MSWLPCPVCSSAQQDGTCGPTLYTSWGRSLVIKAAAQLLQRGLLKALVVKHDSAACGPACSYSEPSPLGRAGLRTCCFPAHPAHVSICGAGFVQRQPAAAGLATASMIWHVSEPARACWIPCAAVAVHNATVGMQGSGCRASWWAIHAPGEGCTGGMGRRGGHAN